MPSRSGAARFCCCCADHRTPRQIARQLGCTDQTVRNVIRAFASEGLACLAQKSSAPKTRRPELDEAKRERLRADTEQIWLRFVDGRPASGVTTQFLAWSCERLRTEGKKALLLVSRQRRVACLSGSADVD
jgi:transposase